MTLELADAGYADAVTAPLIAEIQQELTARYGGPDETPVDPSEFSPPTGCFVVASLDGVVVGCAGLRRVDDDSVELKRMYVRASYRRRGLARQLLAGLEERARQLGYRRVLLETGLAQPEAIALYQREGYQRITGFGHYSCHPTARSFAKDLPPD